MSKGVGAGRIGALLRYTRQGLSSDDNPLHDLEARLGYEFRDPTLLIRALTHKSYSHEAPEGSAPHNETFEFLGDSVLGFIIGDFLFGHFPEVDEGALSKMKAYLVSSSVLARKAKLLGMGVSLRLGVGEERSGGRQKDSLLANLFEAVIAAIYLDGGIEPIRSLVREWFAEDIRAIDEEDLLFHDYKTALQEIAQGNGLPLPVYEVVEEVGPDHEKRFIVEVRVSNEIVARGEGTSKKEAQQQAARHALQLRSERQSLSREHDTGDDE